MNEIKAIFYILSGYYTCKINGENLIRFLNIVKSHDIYIKCLKKINNDNYIKVKCCQYKQICEIAKKCNIKIEVIKSNGLRKIYDCIAKKIYALMGITLAFLLSKFFIFDSCSVDINGNTIYSDEEIMNCINCKYTLDGDHEIDSLYDVSRYLKDSFEYISYVNITKKGYKYYIDIKESVPVVKDVSPYEKGESIISEYDGVIKKIVVSQGVAQVNVGDEVTAGQAIIVGKYDLYNDSLEVVDTVNVIPEGEIFIETELDYYDEIDSYVESFENQVITTGINIEFLGYNIQIGDSEDSIYEISSHNNAFETINEKLQMKITINKSFSGDKIKKEIDKNYLRNEMSKRMQNFLTKKEKKSIHIIDNNVKIYFEHNKCIAKGKLKLLIQI